MIVRTEFGSDIASVLLSLKSHLSPRQSLRRRLTFGVARRIIEGHVPSAERSGSYGRHALTRANHRPKDIVLMNHDRLRLLDVVAGSSVICPAILDTASSATQASGAYLRAWRRESTLRATPSA